MNQPITGRSPLAAAMCDALGIDGKTCVAFELRIAVDEAVTVKIERLVYDNEAQALIKVLDVCRLVAPDDEQRSEQAAA